MTMTMGLQAVQGKGLALILELANGPAAAAAAQAAATAAAALPVYYVCQRNFTAKALSTEAPDVAVRAAPDVLHIKVEHTRLKPIWSPFLPQCLLRTLVKNLGIQFLMKFNHYMLDVLEHEKQVNQAEEQGDVPPPPPGVPDFTPALHSGLFTFTREVLITFVRRIYEHLTVRKLGPSKAEPFLRDSKAWIRDHLAIRFNKSPIATRFYKYTFATLHSTALFYAADCTVAIGFHTYRTCSRKDFRVQQKLAYWAKGAALQVLRCTVVLTAVSLGAAAGSLVKPGIGTFVGHVGTDIAVSITMGIFITRWLE